MSGDLLPTGCIVKYNGRNYEVHRHAGSYVGLIDRELPPILDEKKRIVAHFAVKADEVKKVRL
ncbi:hypothetical protein SEA_LITTLEFELLA_88 [Gordonia phage LittleFella]|nr:hypothetical protein SEA_LITTLEFELLA_88 [Gordonia phage LittleFella]